jgi:class 3 adenylate cyclase
MQMPNKCEQMPNKSDSYFPRFKTRSRTVDWIIVDGIIVIAAKFLRAGVCVHRKRVVWGAWPTRGLDVITIGRAYTAAARLADSAGAAMIGGGSVLASETLF